MKKLIAFAVGLALVTGGLFAVDLGGNFIGTVKLVTGNNAKQWDIDKYDDRTDPTNTAVGGMSLINPIWVGEGSASNPNYEADGAGWKLTAAAEAALKAGALSTTKFVKNPDFITMGWGKEKGNKLGSDAMIKRIRIEGGGETDDGVFGGWLRFENHPWYDPSGHTNVFGNAWWKPIDMLLIRIGSNGGDGYYGKDNHVGWGFYQTSSDTEVTNANAAWGGGDFYYGMDMCYRDAFFGGYGDNALYVEFKPLDMIGINLVFPYFNQWGTDVINVFKKAIAQIDVNLDFGNIALTYVGDMNELGIGDFKFESERYDMRLAPNEIRNGASTGFYRWDTEQRYSISGIDASPTKFFLSVDVNAIDNLGLNVGFGYSLPVKYKDYNDYNTNTIHYTTTTTYQAPLAVGLGAKYGMGDFAVKARVVAKFAGKYKWDEQRAPMDTDLGLYQEAYLNQDPYKLPFQLMGEIMPFYAMSDTMRIYFAFGLGFIGKSKYEKQVYYAPDNWAVGDPPSIGKVTYKADSQVGWHINPYVEVGSEWGAKFVAGVRIWSDGKKVESPLYEFTRGYDPLNRYAGSKKAIVKWEVPIALMVNF